MSSTGARTRAWAPLLFALGIRFVGARVARLLAAAFPDIAALMAASVEELVAIDEIGPKVAASVLQFFQHEENRRRIEVLRQAGRAVSSASKVRLQPRFRESDSPVAGKTIVLTGTLERDDQGRRKKASSRHSVLESAARYLARPTIWWRA